MELLHTFFQKIPMAALFLSVAIGYWVGKIQIGKFQLGGMAGIGQHVPHDLPVREHRPEVEHMGVRAMDRIRRIRRTDKNHNFTLVCSDLSEISTYARVDNWAYRMLKAMTPGPYTFILPATREVPKRLQHPKRRTIGLRVPDHSLVRAVLEALGEPIMSSTLLLPGDDLPLTDPYEIQERIGHEIDLIIDAGPTGIEPTSVIDLSQDKVEVLRVGRGDVSALL